MQRPPFAEGKIAWADVPARRFMFPERKNNERLYDNLYEGTI